MIKKLKVRLCFLGMFSQDTEYPMAKAILCNTEELEVVEVE